MIRIPSSKRWIFVFTIIVLTTFAACDALPKMEQSQDAKLTSGTTDDIAEPPQPRWELLNCPNVVNNPASSRRIKRVTIKLLSRQNAPWGRGFSDNKDLVYTTSEQALLEAFEAFLDQPLRIAVAPGSHGAFGDGSSSSVGTIDVQTSKDKFTIHISVVGFVLDSDSADLQNTFYSWGLAHFLDDLCAKRAGTRIPVAVMKELSGEARIEKDRKVFADLKGVEGRRNKGNNNMDGSF